MRLALSFFVIVNGEFDPLITGTRAMRPRKVLWFLNLAGLFVPVKELR